MGLTEIWTIIAIVLKLCGVGAFASWDIVAMPWHWSCLCIEMWSLILYALILFIILLKAILSSK